MGDDAESVDDFKRMLMESVGEGSGSAEAAPAPAATAAPVPPAPAPAQIAVQPMMAPSMLAPQVPF